MSAVSKTWGEVLSQSQRLAWQNFARHETYTTRLGVKYTPTGYQGYMKRNLIVAQFGWTLMSDPPEQDPPMAATEIIHVPRIPGQYFVELVAILAGVLVYADCDFVEYWQSPIYVASGRHAQPNDYRFRVIVDAPESIVTPMLGTADSIWYRARMVSTTGIHSGWFEHEIRN